MGIGKKKDQNPPQKKESLKREFKKTKRVQKKESFKKETP
ncbi:hypothetical protein HpCOL25_15340 [Helicobacter pylori]|uniref:Uncharacterized protein n=1 Tax=Helicobacter pylori PZ5024 TaxID=1337391 RepID=T2T3K0_HELPX|nr:hypothetical protein L931_09265 [Helicobacter pylori PZ5024]